MTWIRSTSPSSSAIRSQCGLCPMGIATVRALVREPVHRRQLSDVTLLPRREHVREHTFGSGRNQGARRGELGPAADVITAALLHDPGWLAVGPDHTAQRRFVATRYHRGALRIMQRFGGPIYGAFTDEGALAGVAATFAAGRYPPPAWTFLYGVPAFALAGPGPIVRGLRTSAIQDSGHPDEEHVFLWFLTVDPRTSARRHRPPAPRARNRRSRGARLPRHGQPGQPPLLRERRLRGDRPRRAAARRDDVVHEASLSLCASGSPSSFFSVLFSIWRMRSRVTPNARPTSSSVRALWPFSP